jgi:hypothetical protein
MLKIKMKEKKAFGIAMQLIKKQQSKSFVALSRKKSKGLHYKH